jgi:hypothetical protein
MILTEKYLRERLFERKAQAIKMMYQTRVLWEWHEAYI